MKALTPFLLLLVLTPSCKSLDKSHSTTQDIEVSRSRRNELVLEGRVFQGIDSPSTLSELEIKNGPFPPGAKKGKDYFEWGETVTCRYSEKNFRSPPSGLSPKFLCDILDANGAVTKKEVKIKYDARNPEVYNEPAAARLLWLLGFPADNYYPVKVKCLDCPQGEDIWSFIKKYKVATPEQQAGMKKQAEAFQGKELLLNPALIEKKWAEEVLIENTEDSGWAFADDLAVPKEQLRFSGAELNDELAKRHALTILAGMLSHVDNQPGNQRIYCKAKADDGTCAPGQVYLVMQDLGATMGGFRLSWDIRSAVTDNSQLELAMRTWQSSQSTAVFTNKNECRVSVASLASTQTLGPRKIANVSEAGRKFLLSRFVALGGGTGEALTAPVLEKIREQLSKVFQAGRNAELYQNTDWWVNTVVGKITLIAEHKGCQR